VNDTLTQTNSRRIVDLSAKHRLPSVFTSREFVDAGGLMAYGPNFTDLYRRAATYVDKIFKGAKPADLPVEQPTKFELVIKPQDCEGARAEHPADTPAAGGSGDPVITRRVFVGSLTGGFLAAPLAAKAQPAGEVRRVGYLSMGSPTSPRPLWDELLQSLRELGWVENRNIVVEYQWAEGKSDRLPALAAELIRLKVDVIVVGSTPAAVAAKNATGTIPIVIVGVADPVRRGLVASLARPGGNVTGSSFDVDLDTFGKQLELLRELLPKVLRVAVLWNPATQAQSFGPSKLKAPAQSLGVQLHFLEARAPNEFDVAFAAMAKDRVEALLVLPNSMFGNHRVQLADLAAKNRLPSMHGEKVYVEAGCLMSYGPNQSDLFRRAATFVDRILKGAKPGDLPVEQPTKFELVINLKTAKALRLTIPQTLLQRADQVIQ
jgi:putative tryptophan/tyrosine transport system substrate-binding protein